MINLPSQRCDGHKRQHPEPRRAALALRLLGEHEQRPVPPRPLRSRRSPRWCSTGRSDPRGCSNPPPGPARARCWTTPDCEPFCPKPAGSHGTQSGEITVFGVGRASTVQVPRRPATSAWNYPTRTSTQRAATTSTRSAAWPRWSQPASGARRNLAIGRGLQIMAGPGTHSGRAPGLWRRTHGSE